MNLKKFLIANGILILFFIVFLPIVISSPLPSWLILFMAVVGGIATGYLVVQLITRRSK